MTLEILKYPDERLKQKSVAVEKFDSELHRFLNDMYETMAGSRGIGLAAAQVARFERIFIIDISVQDETHPNLYEFINPVLSDKKGKIAFEEGCLSVPDFTELVDRFESLTVNYQDRHGHPRTLEASELLAVAIQHEHDHLDGILFVDHLSLLKRRLFKRKMKKAMIL